MASFHAFHMDNQPQAQQLFFNDPGFFSLPHHQMEEAFLKQQQQQHAGLLVDPNLEHGPSALGNSPDMASVHSIQRFMQDGGRTAIFGPPPAYPAQTSYLRRPLETPPVPPVSQGRHGSPFSRQPSSSGSDIQSPPTVSDVLPTTPPDTSVTSPFHSQSQHLDYWEHQTSPLFALRGLETQQSNGCVNLQDVNPLAHEFSEPSLETLSSSLSFVAGEPHLDIDFPGQDSEFFTPAMSPRDVEAPVKDEIHVREVAAYPHPDQDNASDSEGDMKPPKGMDTDKEWKPRASRKRTRSGSFKGHAAAARTAVRGDRKRINTGGVRRNHGAPVSARGSVHCSECKNATFQDQTALDKHMKQQHTRPFVCIFNFAGCQSTFASKNEWKRHTISQHIVLDFWLCTHDPCCKNQNPLNSRGRLATPSSSSSGSTPVPSPVAPGTIFNRKDLYTQHVRRMHVPPVFRKAQKLKKATPEWDDRLKVLQNNAHRVRCLLPDYMRCPVAQCHTEFRGATAWDDRMEHVAKHLEKAATGDEPEVQFGGEADNTLTDWATDPNVDIVRKVGESQWELFNPLKGDASVSPSGRAPARREALGENSDADADGEEE